MLPQLVPVCAVCFVRAYGNGGNLTLRNLKVSSVPASGSGRELSPLETDMAEQGRKARASAARLEEAGAVGVPGGGEGTNEALSGMMPLRCRVSGR